MIQDHGGLMLMRYFGWLRSQSTAESVGLWIELTLPYLDCRNDFIQVYVRREGDRLVIMDAGHATRDPRLAGWDADEVREKAASILSANSPNLSLSSKGEIRAEATDETFPMLLHGVAMAIMAIGALLKVSN